MDVSIQPSAPAAQPAPAEMAWSWEDLMREAQGTLSAAALLGLHPRSALHPASGVAEALLLVHAGTRTAARARLAWHGRVTSSGVGMEQLLAELEQHFPDAPGDLRAVRAALQHPAPTDEERAAQLALLHAFATSMLAPLQQTLLRPRGLRLRRRLRWLAAISVVVTVAISQAPRVGRGPNLARGRPVTTSSEFPPHPGRAGVVDGVLDVMGFCTNNEDRPWVQVDLGAVQSVREVHVYNRSDCCSERAIPLAVEVSEDGRSWREVAKRQDVFDVWKHRFEPVRARHVRLRLLGRNHLHLNEVEVY
ncbi:MAG: discoidin domain-containing protein [Myxococcota bacterium]